MIAFVWGLLLTCNFELFPSFLAFTVGWALLATMEQAQKHPSPWNQPRSYTELLTALLLNKTWSRPRIALNQNLEKIQEYNATKAALEHAHADALKNMQMEQEKYEAFIEKESHNLEEGNVDISTKEGGGLAQIALAPFKSILLPAQLHVHKICVALRVTKSIVMWRESGVAFWIVTASFAASIVLSLIPWAFLISWSFKILVWTFLGPWMKIVDICYVRRRQNLTKEQKMEDLAEIFQERYSALLGESEKARVKKETALKKKDIKRYMFGQVRSTTRSASCGISRLLNKPSHCTYLVPYACPSIQGRAIL
jgi:hypothetical protein